MIVDETVTYNKDRTEREDTSNYSRMYFPKSLPLSGASSAFLKSKSDRNNKRATRGSCRLLSRFIRCMTRENPRRNLQHLFRILVIHLEGAHQFCDLLLFQQGIFLFAVFENRGHDSSKFNRHLPPCLHELALFKLFHYRPEPQVYLVQLDVVIAKIVDRNLALAAHGSYPNLQLLNTFPFFMIVSAFQVEILQLVLELLHRRLKSGSLSIKLPPLPLHIFDVTSIRTVQA